MLKKLQRRFNRTTLACLIFFLKSQLNEGFLTVHSSAISYTMDRLTGALETKLKEHKRAVQVGDSDSKVARHTNQFVHSIDFNYAPTEDK